MEYDILKGLSALASSGDGLGEKLKKASGLALELLGADQCCVYIRDDAAEVLRLRAASGAPSARVKSYDGVDCPAGRALAEGSPVRAGSGDEGRDKGLVGFASAYAVPLFGCSEPLGVLYAKWRAPRGVTARRAAMAEIAALNISALLCADAALGAEERSASEIDDLKVRLRNAERYMALGDMAATLAHEIKNPLVSIGGFASRVKRNLLDNSPAHKYVDQMLEEIKRLEKITDGAVRVLKEDLLDLKPDDVNDIVDAAFALFEDECDLHGIDVIIDLSARPPAIMADREQLKIAFDNLIANAIQSMNAGGTLRLSTSAIGDWVIVEVEDSGGGIEPRHLNQIFSPFFTTKPGGSGLGLQITHSIIARHKGEIDVVNKKGVGALFSVRLPRARAGGPG